jgi:hypothetical protein
MEGIFVSFEHGLLHAFVGPECLDWVQVVFRKVVVGRDFAI